MSTHTAWSRALLALAAVAPSACGPVEMSFRDVSPPMDTLDQGDAEAGVDAHVTTDVPALDAHLPPLSGCTAGVDDVLLMGFDLSHAVLKRFAPRTMAVTDAGTLAGCPVGSGFAGRDPWGAALARNGTLYAHFFEWDTTAHTFSYNRIFTIDTRLHGYGPRVDSPEPASVLRVRPGVRA